MNHVGSGRREGRAVEEARALLRPRVWPHPSRRPDSDVVHEPPPRLAPPVYPPRETDVRHCLRIVRADPERAALAVIALLVRLSPGPVIYRQTRVGAGGKPFTMLKFRTMRADSEPDCASYTAVGDARVTRIGRVLRMTHLDELPQLWNVLKGQMSVVGPRPERPEFIPMLEKAIPFFSRRLLIKPGVTGWAQLRSDYSSDAEGAANKLSYDLWYLRHRNLLVDLAICAKTFTSVVLRPGR